MKKAKTSTPVLPSLDARKTLGDSQRTLIDYAKATPLGLGRPNPDPNIIQNLRRPRK